MTETSATKPPQLRAARARKQSIIKFVILFVTLAFLFVPLLAMLIFTLRHPLSGRWSAAPWIAIFTGNGESLGADLTVLWQGIGTSLALSAVTVVIMLVLLVPTMVIVHIRSKVLERAIEWVATLPLTIPAIVLVVGLGPIYRWLSADVLSTNPIWLCFAYVILVMPFAFRALAVGLNSIDVKTLVEASRSLLAQGVLQGDHPEPMAVDSLGILYLHRRGAGRIHRRLAARPYEPAGRALPARPVQFSNLHRHVAAGSALRCGAPRCARPDLRRNAQVKGR